MTTETATFEGWCILELMGHRRLAGYVTEQEIAGGKFLRIDVPGTRIDGTDGTVACQFYGAAAVYCLTPTSEEIARAIAKQNQPTPVHRWELAPAPSDAAPSVPDLDDGGDDDDTF